MTDARAADITEPLRTERERDAALAEVARLRAAVADARFYVQQWNLAQADDHSRGWLMTAARLLADPGHVNAAPEQYEYRATVDCGAYIWPSGSTDDEATARALAAQIPDPVAIHIDRRVKAGEWERVEAKQAAAEAARPEPDFPDPEVVAEQPQPPN